MNKEIKPLPEEEVKMLQSEASSLLNSVSFSHGVPEKINFISVPKFTGDSISKLIQKSYTLGMMKGVEMVELVIKKEASAKHDNHEDWQDGDCDCDGVFDYSEIKYIMKKFKPELK